MNNTTTYAQVYDDCECTVEVDWEIEYVNGPDGIEIVGTSIMAAFVMFGEVKQRVALDQTTAIEKHCRPHLERVCRESVEQVCLDHWEVRGKYLDDEGRRVA